MGTAYTLGSLGYSPAGTPSRASGDTVFIDTHVTSVLVASISATVITNTDDNIIDPDVILSAGKYVTTASGTWYKSDTMHFPAVASALTTQTYGILLTGAASPNPSGFEGNLTGTYSVVNLTNAKIFHGTTWGAALANTGTLAASTIGTVSGTTNATASNVKNGVTIDDVAGTYDPVTGSYSDPGIVHVQSLTTYTFAGATLTGSFLGGERNRLS